MTVSNLKQKTPMIAFVELVSGFWITQAMSVAAKLGLADCFQDEVKSVDDLAKEIEVDSRSLYRLLRTLASVNVFTEVEQGKFKLTSVGEYLRSDNPDSLRDLAIMHGDDWHWGSIGQMYRKFKEGKPVVHYLYQVDSYWEYLEKNPASQTLFNEAMVAVAKNFHTPFIESYDFSSFTRVVDIAGGQGTVLSSILKSNPHLEGVVFDLPRTVDEATQFLKSQGVADRCQTIGGDMFKSVPAGGDLYVMSYIMADWDKDSCIAILKNVHEAIKKNGKLLVIDSIIPAANEHSWIKWLDLFELCMGYGGPRTKEEYSAIFQEAGFKWSRTIDMNTPCSAMELIPNK
jgi:hypothetical protein